MSFARSWTVGYQKAGAITMLALATAIGAAGVSAAQDTIPHSKTEQSPEPTKGESAHMKRWGVESLPVPEASLIKYRLKKRHVPALVKSIDWADSHKARSIRQRESGGNYNINTGNGYYGAWQFDRGTWLANGGARFSHYAHQAPKWAQDYVAYRTYRARGWAPWGG